MNRINVFISYSSEQKTIGGRFKSYLIAYCGYETFIAHTDIPGSSVWEEEIIKAIEYADFFIPLITDDFKTSDFTDQETGIAVYCKKKIIPIKLAQRNPYGFINKYQALQYKTHPPSYYLRDKDNIKELILTVAQIGLSYEPQSIYHQKALTSIVYAFCTSNSFDTTNAIIEIMLKCTDLSVIHLKQIRKAIKENSQIQGAFGLENLKTFLQKTYNVSID